MSGRNIFLVLIAVAVVVGIYALVTDPTEVPIVPTEMPSLVAPRAAAPPPPAVEQRVEPAPVLDDVANDAAEEVERLKKAQEEMNEKPPVMTPEMGR